MGLWGAKEPKSLLVLLVPFSAFTELVVQSEINNLFVGGCGTFPRHLRELSVSVHFFSHLKLCIAFNIL